MTLYKAELAEIETTDGFYSTFADPSYDLDVTVTPTTISPQQTELDVTPNPIQATQTADITVTTKDIYGNPLTTGGETVTLSITGANTATPTVTDNADGTYSAQHTPVTAGTDLIQGTIGGSAIAKDTDGTSDGTFHLVVSGATADHFTVTGNTTQDAGSAQTITITAQDAGGNTDATYSGTQSITFSGANPAPNASEPTCRDINGDDIAFGSPTDLEFTNGEATCQLYLYKAELAEIDVTDGTLDSTGDPSYDLDVTVSQDTFSIGDTLLDAAPNPVNFNETTAITVTARDQYHNQIPTGGETVTLSITGANTATPTVTDNADGTYSAEHIPPNGGTDLITATINTQAVTQDTDGTSDGTFHLTVSAIIPDHFVITGNATQEAGTTQTITITAQSSADETAASYTGDKTLTFSGSDSAPDGTEPVCTDKNSTTISFGSDTVLTFTDGVATCDLTLYKTGSSEIETTDGTLSTEGSQDYDLNVEVSATGIDTGASILSATPDLVTANEEVSILLTIYDQYQNPLSIGGETVTMTVSGANTNIPAVTDNNDGTYSAEHIPENPGIDLITATINTQAVTQDTDGTSDGTFYLTVEEAAEESIAPQIIEIFDIEVDSAKIKVDINNDTLIGETLEFMIKLKNKDENDTDMLSFEKESDEEGNVTFFLKDLEPKTAYAVKVMFTHNDVATEYSDTETFRTKDDLEEDDATPSNLKATAKENSILLTWKDNSETENGYLIERKTQETDFEQIAEVGKNTETYEDTDVLENVYYTYRVRAYEGDDHSEYSNEAGASIETDETDERNIPDPREDPDDEGDEDEEDKKPTPEKRKPKERSDEVQKEEENILSAVLGTVSGVTESVAKAIGFISETAGSVSKTIAYATSTVGLTAALATILSTLPSTGLPFIPPQGILPQGILFPYRKKKPHWGVVFDTYTKRPIEKAVVQIINQEGRIVETVITDTEGRYGFLAKEGVYSLQLKKENYEIDTTKKSDTLYGDLYDGSPIHIDELEVAKVHIAARNTKVDWSSYAKRKVAHYTSTLSSVFRLLMIALFWFGCIVSLIAVITNPTILNIIIVIVYGVFIVLKLITKKSFGTVRSAQNNRPISFAAVELFDAQGRRVKFAISDVLGRYYLLAPSGTYSLRVKGTILGGRRFEKTSSVTIRGGILREKVEV